jgi:septal ring factor EnvC (AmiA/AmiB activator)
LKKKSLSGDKIQRELEKLESQRRGVNTQLIDAQPKLHKLNREIDELTKVSDKDQTLLDALVEHDFTRSRHLVIVADVHRMTMQRSCQDYLATFENLLSTLIWRAETTSKSSSGTKILRVSYRRLSSR